MRPRLLFYTHALVGGGAERVWALAASGLHARGYDVAFAVDFEAPENRHLLPETIPYHVLGRGHVDSTRALARLLAEKRPQIAFAAIGASNVKLLAAKTLGRWRGATILSVHGRYAAESRLLGRATYLATPVTSRLSSRTIAVSEDLRHYLITQFRSDARRTVVIHNGVALPSASALPSREELAARPDVILAVGRLVPEKGFTSLVRAFARVRRSAQLIILGEGPERANLQHVIDSCGLKDRVELTGYVRDPGRFYATAKMLVLSSRTEAFGNVLVEAMGYGLPVVATRCGGPEEVLGNGVFGKLVPVDDDIGLSQAIESVLDAPGDPSAHRARANVFSLEHALDRFEALITQIPTSGQ
jgi:glycosyltransferase involved in cell wall biosynthesis